MSKAELRDFMEKTVLVSEDFLAEAEPLDDSEASKASGGIRLPYQPLIKDDKFVFL